MPTTAPVPVPGVTGPPWNFTTRTGHRAFLEHCQNRPSMVDELMRGRTYTDDKPTPPPRPVTRRRKTTQPAGEQLTLALDFEATSEPDENINARRKRLLTEALLADPDGWTQERVQALYAAAGDHVDINTCWGWLRHLTVVEPVTRRATTNT